MGQHATQAHPLTATLGRSAQPPELRLLTSDAELTAEWATELVKELAGRLAQSKEWMNGMQ